MIVGVKLALGEGKSRSKCLWAAAYGLVMVGGNVSRVLLGWALGVVGALGKDDLEAWATARVR